jgi:hypothetical protein
MLLGLASKIRLSATAELDGCWNTTLPSALMLNDDQFNVAVLLVCRTDNVLPAWVADAIPVVTNPLAEVPQLVATQGSGNWVAATDRPPEQTMEHSNRPCFTRLCSDRSSLARMLRRY